MKTALVLVSASLAGFAACTVGGDRIVTQRVDSAGIEVVTNRGGDRALRWTFSRRLSLGGKAVGPEAFYRINRNGVGSDRADNIYVLDFDAVRVEMFDSAGQHVRTLGRPGSGPGELDFPTALHVSPAGLVSVLDFAKSGAVGWAPDGSLLATRRIKATSPVMAVAFLSDGAVYAQRSLDPQNASQRTSLYVEHGDSLVELTHMNRSVPPMAEFAGCEIALRLAPIFAPEMSWAERDGRVASISGPGYEIAVRDSTRRMLIRRDLPPRAATPELAVREVGDTTRVSAGTTHCAVPAAEVVAKRGVAPVVPALRDVMLAPDGTIWALRGGPASDPSMIDIFDDEGAYVGTIPPGSPIPIGFLGNGDVLSEELDESTGIERLVVHRVVRPRR